MLAAGAAIAAVAVWIASGGLSGPRAGPFGLVNERRGLFTTASDVDGFFVVHPQEPIMPTGIFVRRGQSISAWADGSVNIALARLVEAVGAGDAVAYEWVGPAGEVDGRGQPILRADRAHAGRERCLLNRAYPYGTLLLLVTPADRPLPGAARALVPDREIFSVGAHLEAVAPVAGYLSLGVNDVYLDREECDPEEFAAGRQAGAYFRDNVGFFSARLRVH